MGRNAEYNFGNFLSHNHQTYIVLKEGTDPVSFEKNFDQVIDKYIVPQAKQFMDISSMDDFEKAGNKLEYSLMPLTDIHLHSDRVAELGVNGNIQYVYIFATIALVVLLIACINFMNLSTARSANRAREVGIRKVLGTNRGSLIRQFLFESILTTFLACLIAVGVAVLLHHFHTQYFGILVIYCPYLHIHSIFRIQYRFPGKSVVVAGRWHRQKGTHGAGSDAAYFRYFIFEGPGIAAHVACTVYD